MRIVDPPTRSLPWALGVAAVLSACTASGDQVAPPKNQFFFPTGLAVSPDNKSLFVTNANSELRWDSGSIQVVDLDKVDAVSAAWLSAGTVPTDQCDGADCCAPDPDHTETLTCDESVFIRVDAGVRIGNFATDIAVQDMGSSLRLIVPTRGDPSIAWITYDGSKLSCSNATVDNALCDDAHRLSSIHNDPDIAALPDEPFAVYADSVGEYAVVTHLTTGAVTLIDSRPGVNAVVADVVAGVFAADPSTGLRGATGVTGRPNGSDGSIIYVGSRSEDRVQTFSVARPVNGPPNGDALPFLLTGSYFFLNGVGGNAGGSIDTRGMMFSANGDRLYLVNRRPPTLQIIDTSLNDSGFPINQTIGATDVCRQASTLTLMDSGDGERAYVTCFQDGEMYVVDPRGQSQVDDILTVGRGPYSVVGAPTRKKLYVTNVLENTIAVVDATPGSDTRNRVVLRLGKVLP